jgi:hypothetical protein
MGSVESPASRLLKLVEAFKAVPPKKEVWWGLAKALGIEGVATGNDLPLLFHFLQIAYTQIELARERASKGALGQTPEIFNAPLDRLKFALNATVVGLNAQWSGRGDEFATVETELRILAALDKGSLEPIVPDEVIADLLAAIKALRDSRDAQGMTEAARAVLQRQINELVALVAAYGIGGARSFSDRVFQSLADLKSSPPDFSEVPPNVVSTISAAWTTAVQAVQAIGAVGGLIEFAQAIAGALEANSALPLPFFDRSDE